MFAILRHSALQPSNQNPRKVFRGLEELAESIRVNGVIETISVRPLDATGERYEIIAGERRWRSSKIAGLEDLPCRVFNVSAREAFDIALEENGQRKDLTPIEEAEAYTYAVHAYGHTVEELAARTGHSTRHILQRMRLTNLSDGFRKLLEIERLGIAAALAIAALPKDVQHEIERENLERWSEGDNAITASQIERALQSHLRPLDRAPFDTADATLVPDAGPCGACPKRSGRQGDLFDATGRADSCLDAGCYQDKAIAGFGRRVEEATKIGLRVLTEAEARAAIRWGMVDSTSEYSERPSDDVEATAIAQCPDTFKILELVPAKVARAAKKAAKKARVDEIAATDPDAAARAARLELVQRTMASAAEIAAEATPYQVASAVLERLAADDSAVVTAVLGQDVAAYLTEDAEVAIDIHRAIAVILTRTELRIGADTPIDTTPPVLVRLGIELPEIAALVRAETKGAKAKPAKKAKAPKPAAKKAPAKKAAKKPKPAAPKRKAAKSKVAKKGGAR